MIFQVMVHYIMGLAGAAAAALHILILKLPVALAMVDLLEIKLVHQRKAAVMAH
jgi:hypothetical protein